MGKDRRRNWTPQVKHEFDSAPRDLAKMRKEHACVDGEEFLLKCSTCDEPLIGVLVIQPDMPTITHISAKCCYCGDKSFQETVEGGYVLKHLDKVVMVNQKLELVGELEFVISIETQKEQ
jgi:hypothetical protein